MIFECNICEKAFASSYELRIHMDTHKKDRPFKCDKCEKAFTVSSNLKSHKLTHTDERPFKCNKCPKAFSRSLHLKMHKRIHTGERPFKCDKCPQIFSQSQNLKRHERIHTKERPFKCDTCPKTFTQSQNLKRHLRIHREERRFKCDTCPKTFSQSQNLKRHERIHTEGSPFKCNQCDKTFSQSHNLKRHKFIHTGERPFKCDECHKTFSQSTNFKRHERTHRRETTFKCSKCPKVFTQYENVKRHELTHIWRPYDFNLTTPINIHEEEKTFKCRQCDVTFLVEDNLKSHMYESHWEDEANHSMQSYINIQSSTTRNPEQHSFQYGIFDQNIADHSNSSTRFNSLDEATISHEIIPQNIQTSILPSDVHVKTLGAKNIAMPILDKSTKHPQKCVSFAAGSTEQLSSISDRAEENQFNFDIFLKVSSQYEISSERLSLNALHFLHEYQQSNTMEETFLNTNTRSTPTNTDMDSQMHTISLVHHTSNQNFKSSSIHNEESLSTSFEEFESNVSIQHNILDLFPSLK